MAARQYQCTPPPMPKIEEDGALDSLSSFVWPMMRKIKQHRVLLTATEFRYGYKLVESSDLRAALSTSDFIELPTQDQHKTVFDKVKDSFGDAIVIWKDNIAESWDR